MLVLSRKAGERILIGDDVVITVVRIGPHSVHIGIEAPETMNIVRSEIVDAAIAQSGDAIASIGDVDAPTPKELAEC